MGRKSNRIFRLLNHFSQYKKYSNFSLNPLIKTIFLGLIIFNLLLTSWYILHGDLNFHTDIGRDFLLFEEVQQKKLVLIGARSGAAGIFHGPLWLYLNFPVYYLSNGNPLAVGWFWIFLIVFFYISGFQIAKRLFNSKTAFLFITLASSYLIPWGKEFTHHNAAFVIMPFFFYTFWQYINTFKITYLMAHIILAGILIQLEIATGGPFILLSFAYIVYKQIKKHRLKQSIAFLLIFLPLSTYIMFDIRHNFFQIKNLIAYIKGSPSEHYYGIVNIFKNRLDYIFTSGTPLIREFTLLNTLFAISLFIILFKILNKSRYRYLYLIFLYFYLGYFLISLSSRYYLLVQHFLPFIPIVLMVSSSLISSKYQKITVPIFILIILFNLFSGIKYLREANNDIGRSMNSWKIFNKISEDVYNNQDQEFGYFIYSPDKLGYSLKYAMIYGQKIHPNRKASYFQKMPITYVISAPPPINDPYAKYMKSQYWVANSIKISGESNKTVTYPNDYKVERYELTPEEIAIPFDKYEDTGIHFR